LHPYDGACCHPSNRDADKQGDNKALSGGFPLTDSCPCLVGVSQAYLHHYERFGVTQHDIEDALVKTEQVVADYHAL